LSGASLKGSQFKIDNFKVSQLLKIALADGSASIFTATHPGDGRRAYLDLDQRYAGSFRKETRVQQIMAKLITIQYQGAKSFLGEIHQRPRCLLQGVVFVAREG
jgi:hypothetical protein